ncbi:MAG: HD domain-containing phosphohydrolase [Pseudohongiellaceae bacterium]
MDRRFVESEESLFDKVPSPLFRVQREGGRFIFTDANAAGHLLTGGKIADLYGREVSEIWSSPKSRHIAENIRRVQQTRQMQEETFWHTFVSDHKRRYVHIDYVPYRDDEILLFVFDLTEQREAEGKLRNALVDTVKAVAATVAIHDRYTARHMQRVAGVSVEIGKAMGLSEDELLGLSLGASIFDIGKIGIPSSILSKPGKLTEAEFELIKEHPVLGVEVIRNIEFSWPIREMIRQHHERLDGSGYPDGLKDDDIILEARIIAVADVYEALISHRPYRAANDPESARSILSQEKGRLEPDIVDCLFRLIDNGLIGVSAPA